MYLKMLVEIPDAKGKIVLQKKGKTTYVVVRHIRWSRIRQIKRSCLMAS